MVYEAWKAARSGLTYGEWVETEEGRAVSVSDKTEAVPGVPWPGEYRPDPKPKSRQKAGGGV